MTYRIEITPAAVADAEEIYLWLVENAPVKEPTRVNVDALAKFGFAGDLLKFYIFACPQPTSLIPLLRMVWMLWSSRCRDKFSGIYELLVSRSVE
jgi:hypothetical protein